MRSVRPATGRRALPPRPSLGSRCSDSPRHRSRDSIDDLSRSRHWAWRSPRRGRAMTARDRSRRRSRAGRSRAGQYSQGPIAPALGRLLDNGHGVQRSGATTRVRTRMAEAQPSKGARRRAPMANPQSRADEGASATVPTSGLPARSRKNQRPESRVPRKPSRGQARKRAGLPSAKVRRAWLVTGAECSRCSRAGACVRVPRGTRSARAGPRCRSLAVARTSSTHPAACETATRESTR